TLPLHGSRTRVDMASMARELKMSLTYAPMITGHRSDARDNVSDLRYGSKRAVREPDVPAGGLKHKDADGALGAARVLLAVLLEFQDEHFKLGLGEELLADRRRVTPSFRASAGAECRRGRRRRRSPAGPHSGPRGRAGGRGGDDAGGGRAGGLTTGGRAVGGDRRSAGASTAIPLDLRVSPSTLADWLASRYEGRFGGRVPGDLRARLRDGLAANPG